MLRGRSRNRSGGAFMKALIKVGYACNEHCSFCHTQDVREVQGSSAEVEAKIDRAAALGHSMVVLSGGEPTIRPELLQWARRVASHGMDFGLVTNGLVLAYEDIVQRLLEHRLRYVYMSLHGGEARVHNSLVRRDSFEAAMQALRNLRGRGLHLTVNCVVTRHNMDHLLALVDAVLPFEDVTLKFSMVEPKGGAWHLFDRLVPRVADAARRVDEAIRHGLAKRAGAGPRLAHGGFPLCLLPGHERDFDDLKTHRYWTMVEIGEPDFFPVDDLNKVQPASVCEGCELAGACPGLYQTYYDRYGADELCGQRRGPRSNAFDWVFETLVTPDDHGQCWLAAQGHTPWDRGRHLFVRNDGRVARYRADTRDFSDSDIARIKHELGQTYVDVSRKVAPDDFSRDLVKLSRSPLCDGCPHHDSCTGLHEPVFEDVFTADDARVRATLAELRGDVLDVGCGHGPYDDILGPLATAREIRYVGIDPDAQALGLLRQRRPWGELREGQLDGALDSEERFDHVLVLRSWNHLPNADRAAPQLVSALRPGGTLTIVDNVAFGLARTLGQTRLARTGGAAFEHHRNDDATAAHRALENSGLELFDRVDVGPGTSNQWLLRYRKLYHHAS
jgi:MoaA/NifB/PqqE/SkfB family radical SAM enzyme/SAM-dependent methyltransferase